MATVDFERLERLSHLHLSREERASLAADMQQVINFASALSRNTSSEAAPLRQALPLRELREDCPHTPFAPQVLMAAAPSVQDGYITVVRVVEE